MADLKSIIAARRRFYTDHYTKDEYETAVTIYTTDCRYLEAGMGDILGRENLAVAIKGMSDMGYPVLKEEVFEVLPAGEGYAVERSKWELIKPDGKLGLRGIFICLWKKIGDDWYARMECCNGGSD